MSEHDVLDAIYGDALASDSVPECGECNPFCDVIVSHQDTSKGVLAVLITLLVKKISDPQQDIRKHQARFEGGFSGRGLDSRVITPFLKTHRFPSMAGGSGWLTRSLEQAHPYNLDYPGSISPTGVKDAFLKIVDAVQSDGVDPRNVLSRILMGLIEYRDRNTNIALARPTNLTMSDIVGKIEQHYQNRTTGAARLPVLAVYAVMKLVVGEAGRYRGCQVLPLESHTTSDARSGLIGDVHVVRDTGTIYEAFEVKHNIPITAEIIDSAFQKYRTTSVERYYILTTHASGSDHGLQEKIVDLQHAHGCELTVNGVAPTLKYYLRLVTSTSRFVDEYVGAVEDDAAIPYELKRNWDQIVGLT